MAGINPFQAPINYAVDVQSPFEAALSGFKIGAAGAEAQAQAQAREQAMKAQTELKTLFSNPNATASDYERVLPFLPKDQAAIVTQGFERKTKEQQQNTLQQSGQVYTALKSGQSDIAKNLLKDQATAFRNSGREQDAKATETYLQLIDMNPTGAQTTIGLMMATLPGGKELLENVDKTLSTGREELLFPSKLEESTATAKKAAVESKFAESNAVLDLTKKGWDITKVQEDIAIAKENARIAALNASIARETNALKRQENQLKLEDMIEKRDEKVRQVTAEVESARNDMDNFLNTANRILQTPKEVINSATGPIASRLPTTGQATADFEGLVETLGSQAFMSQIPKMKGAGALSEREGDKLQASLQNLSLKQSPERLIENVKESMRLIEKARKTLSIKSGLPETPKDIPSLDLSVTVSGTTYNFPTKAAADAFKNSDAYKKAAGTK
jgi:hypothetical protein